MKKVLIALIILFFIGFCTYSYKDQLIEKFPDIMTLITNQNQSEKKQVEEIETEEVNKEEMSKLREEEMKAPLNLKDFDLMIKHAQEENSLQMAKLHQMSVQNNSNKLEKQEEIKIQNGKDVISDNNIKLKEPEKPYLNQVKLDKNKLNAISFATETADVWTPTFQLCWNEAIKLIGRAKIEYVNGNPKLVNELNKQKFHKYDLSDDAYYISVTKQTLKHKKEIQQAIWSKFKEKSDILNKFDFKDIPDEKTNFWFIYSILSKKFNFIAPFDDLGSDYFNNIKTTKYKYFGINEESKNRIRDINILRSHIDFLFYANDNDYAVKIYDKNRKDELILYLTNSNASFDNLYVEILEKSARKNEFTRNRTNSIRKEYEQDVINTLSIVYEDYIKIPFIKINEEYNYDKELANKPIKGKTYEKDKTDLWKIEQTLQTIKFELDNKGVKLKSEAAISMVDGIAAYNRIITINNHYYFDRPFVMFLKETDKNKPYFAARIKDGKYLVKG